MERAILMTSILNWVAISVFVGMFIVWPGIAAYELRMSYRENPKPSPQEAAKIARKRGDLIEEIVKPWVLLALFVIGLCIWMAL